MRRGGSARRRGLAAAAAAAVPGRFNGPCGSRLWPRWSGTRPQERPRSGFRSSGACFALRAVAGMSQRKRSRGSGPSQADDGDEDFNLSPTLPRSQVQRNLERRSQDQVNQKVSELVQFLLVKDQKKIPIKRADILKKVIREYRDVYSEIVNQAGRTLQQVFGLQLVEIDTRQHIYILTSTIPRTEGENLRRDIQTAKLGLLMVILSFIFMKGNSVKDGAMWEFLRRLRIQPGERHEVFGDIKKLVTEEFVRQKYLEITPIPLTDPPEFKYQWGPRAAKETSKMDVLRFVAKMQGKDPMYWVSQYNEAKTTTL